MSNPYQVHVKNDSELSVYLYSHWGGLSEARKIVKKALVKSISRWDCNDMYMARIIFQEMIMSARQEAMQAGIHPSELDTFELLGFGISNYSLDVPNITVNLSTLKVNNKTFEAFIK